MELWFKTNFCIYSYMLPFPHLMNASKWAFFQKFIEKLSLKKSNCFTEKCRQLCIFKWWSFVRSWNYWCGQLPLLAPSKLRLCLSCNYFDDNKLQMHETPLLIAKKHKWNTGRFQLICKGCRSIIFHYPEWI